MTRLQFKEEAAKAERYVRDFINEKAWKVEKGGHYGIGIQDPRCEFSTVRVSVGSRMRYGGFGDPTGIRVKLTGGPVRAMSWQANTTDQLPWPKIKERITRQLEAATAEHQKVHREEVDRKKREAKADKEAPIPDNLDGLLRRKLQGDDTYSVGLNMMLRADQLNLFMELTTIWDDPGTVETFSKLVANIKKREKK